MPFCYLEARVDKKKITRETMIMSDLPKDLDMGLNLPPGSEMFSDMTSFTIDQGNKSRCGVGYQPCYRVREAHI